MDLIWNRTKGENRATTYILGTMLVWMKRVILFR